MTKTNDTSGNRSPKQNSESSISMATDKSPTDNSQGENSSVGMATNTSPIDASTGEATQNNLGVSRVHNPYTLRQTKDTDSIR